LLNDSGGSDPLKISLTSETFDPEVWARIASSLEGIALSSSSTTLSQSTKSTSSPELSSSALNGSISLATANGALSSSDKQIGTSEPSLLIDTTSSCSDGIEPQATVPQPTTTTVVASAISPTSSLPSSSLPPQQAPLTLEAEQTPLHANAQSTSADTPLLESLQSILEQSGSAGSSLFDECGHLFLPHADITYDDTLLESILSPALYIR
jgi:hypothetical protein